MGINVLSLFDGISCGRVAMDRLGIEVDNYFASEIDKTAIKVSAKNYPNIKHIGSVTEWRDWDLPKIDLLMGGSPCQGFSSSGKKLNFDDPRSFLFFEFLKCLKHFKPKYFFLENVIMDKDCENIITNLLGVNPIHLNSGEVGPHNRPRIYWTNIVDNFTFRRPLSNSKTFLDIMDTKENKGLYILRNDSGLAVSKAAHHFDITNPEYFKIPDPKRITDRCHRIGLVKEHDGRTLSKFEQTSRVMSKYAKAPCCTTTSTHQRGPYMLINEELFISDNSKWRECFRPISILEAERLQGLPDNYTEGIATGKRYHAVGNGWTVEAIMEFFKYMT